MLRWVFMFVMLALGPLGVYFFLRETFLKKSTSASLASLLGALFYLLNLSTLQHFYVPFEMFAVQFAVLPWFFLLILSYLRRREKRVLLLLFVVSFLAAPQAYAAMLFWAFLGGVLFYLFVYSFLGKGGGKLIKESLIVVAVIIAANAFWILPNFYSVLRQSNVIREAKINQLFSTEAFLRNREYGLIRETLLQRSFLFSWREYDFSKGEFVDLLDEWLVYLERPWIEEIGYGLSGLALLGFLLVVFRRNRVGLALLTVGLYCLFFLLNENFPTGGLYLLLREHIGVFKEGLRMPFTKFSILYSFVLSFGFAFFNYSLFDFFVRKRRSLVVWNAFQTVVLAGMLTLFMLPVFRGYLVSPSMRVEIPDEYFEMFGWFEGQPEGRVAKFPVHTPWGWGYYDWGYQGAGFTWFGMSQPTLDREFDRWSKFNEGFYNEISFAVYSEDRELFESVLRKYDVRYLLLDRSILNAGGSKDLLNIDEIENLISNSFGVSKLQDFGFLEVYEVRFSGMSETNFVWAPDDFLEVIADTSYVERDYLYSEFGDYIQTNDGVFYPFVNYDFRDGAGVSFFEDYIEILGDGDFSPDGGLYLPDLFENSELLSVKLYVWPKEEGILGLRFELSYPKILVDGEIVYDNVVEQRDEIRYEGRLGYIVVGDKVFDLDLLDDDSGREVYVGDIKVKSGENVGVSLYSRDLTYEEGVVEGILGSNPRLCGDASVEFSLKRREKNFEIDVGGESVCLGYYFSSVGDNLFKVSYDYDVYSGVKTWFCITREGGSGCVNGIFNRSGGSFVELVDGGYWIDFVVEPGDGGRAFFGDLNIETANLIGRKNYSLWENFSRFVHEEPVQLDGVGRVSARIPVVGGITEPFGEGRGYLKARNCDLQGIGEVWREFGDVGVLYRAENGGVSCDFFDYPGLEYSRGYLLRLKGENREGRGLKIYLYNKSTGKADLEQLLPQGRFDQSFFVLSKNLEGSGYTLNVETRSFGRIASENVLEKIEFVPVPVGWLESLRIGEIERKKNGAVVLEPKKINPIYYKTRVRGEGLIVLSQGYESGWVAFARRPNFRFSISNLRKLEHVKVNGWSNGWMVPEGEHEIYIFYWPQILQWGGFFVLTLVCGGFIIDYFRKK